MGSALYMYAVGVSQVFHQSLRKIPKRNNLKEERFIELIVSEVSVHSDLLHCCEVVVRKSIMAAGRCGSKAAHHMTARKQRDMEKKPETRYTLQSHALSDPLPSVKPHLNSLLNYESINGSVQ
jgi:hypothetical protein